MWITILTWLKAWRYIIFAALIVGFIIAYSTWHDGYVAKQLKPASNTTRSAVGDGAIIRKIGLINF